MKDETGIPPPDFRLRTRRYAGDIVRFFVGLPRRREEVAVLGRQLLRSGTSIAANYREASRARSTAEFVSKIESCAQEADESLLWLELLKDDCGIGGDEIDRLLDETGQLLAILVTMAKNAKRGEGGR